jgi:bile acid:Na+ symporter, BASS family
MNLRMIVGLALKVSIMLTLFGFGLHATREDLLYLLRRPRVLVRSLMAMFVVMPVFAILMTRLGSFNRAVVIALIALSISPVPPFLPRKVTKSGGHGPYSLGLTVTAASFSIVYVPLAVYVIGKYFNRPFAMGAGAVAKLIVLSVLAPLAAGIVFRKVAPGTAERIADPLGRIAGIVLLIGVLCVLAFSLPAAWPLIGNGTILAFIAFAIVGPCGRTFSRWTRIRTTGYALTLNRVSSSCTRACNCRCKCSGRTPSDLRGFALPGGKRFDHDSICCVAAQKGNAVALPGGN